MPDKTDKQPGIISKALLPFDDLCPETREALDAMRRLVSFRAGQVISHEGDESDFIGIVASGVLRMQKTLADGQHPIVGLLVEGDMFGRVFDGATELAIEAATDVEIHAFLRGPFEALLLRSPDLDRAMLLNVLNELDRAREWMVLLTNEKITRRVAGFMLVLCARFVDIDHILTATADGIEVKIPISRLDLAHLLGTRPESISRALHSLADDGAIEILEPNRVLLKNAQILAEEAGEDALETTLLLKGLATIRHLQR